MVHTGWKDAILAALHRLTLALALCATPLSAQEDFLARLEGAYLPPAPEAARFSCDGQWGLIGGRLGIRDGQLIGLENACTLTDPVEVRGMDAMLFDTQCAGEGVEYDGGRVMLMATRAGIAIIRDGSVVEWTRCPD